MTTPTRDDLALYAMGHYDGDADLLERRLAADPAYREQLAEEAELELLLGAAARAATFCPGCHDLVRDERCVGCGVAVPARDLDVRPATRSTRRPMVARALAALTLAAAVAVGFAMRSGRDDPDAQPQTAAEPAAAPGVPVADRRPVDPAPPGQATGVSAVQAPAQAPPPARVPAPAPGPAPAPVAHPPRAPMTARKVVELRIATRPVGVAVVLGDQFLGLTPLVAKVPRSSARVTLSLQHPAYHELVKRLALREDTRLDLALTPTGAPTVHQGRYQDAQCMSCHRPRLAGDR